MSKAEFIHRTLGSLKDMVLPTLDKYMPPEFRGSTLIKIVGLFFTAATIVYGAGRIAMTVSVTDRRVTEVRQDVQDVKSDVKALDKRTQSLEIHGARHDIIDSLVLSAVSKNNALMEEIKQDRRNRP